MPVATIGLFALAIALVALAFLIQNALSGDDDGGLTPAESFQTTQALNATQTAEAGGGNGGDETPQPGQTQTPANGTPGDGGTATTGPEATDTPGNGSGGTTYEVVAGDTCGAIASEFDTTVDEIIAANDLDEACSINVGQVLTIP
jgi:LysM repeat protein